MKIIIFSLLLSSFYIFGSSQILKFSDSTIPYIDEYSNISAKYGYNNELTKKLTMLRCNPVAAKDPKTFWDNYTSVKYTKNNIVSVKIRSTYNCDGLHPRSNVDSSFSYDLENNRLITLFDIFIKKDKIYALIRDNFYQKINDDTCKEKVKFYLESEKLFKEYLNFYFTNKGLVFILKLPYGIKECATDTFISYEDILKKSHPTGALSRVLKKFSPKKKD